MKYFLDTEFIEGFHKPLFGKRRHFIDLISIGIVCEDGRELHLTSREYNYHDADDWVKTNVIIPHYIHTVHGDARNHIDADNFQYHFGLSNKRIAEKVRDFVYEPFELANAFIGGDLELKSGDIEFYAYYADYDWVVFCSLFGRMIDLPKGFPMYCRDLKQIMDDKIKNMPVSGDFEKDLQMAKDSKRYPKQKDEHSALDDARWNFELYKYLRVGKQVI